MGTILSCHNPQIENECILDAIESNDMDQLKQTCARCYKLKTDWPFINIVLLYLDQISTQQLDIILKSAPLEYIKRYDWLYHKILFKIPISIQDIDCIYRKKITWYLYLSVKARNWQSMRIICDHISYTFTVYEQFTCQQQVLWYIQSARLIERRWIEYKIKRQRLMIAHVCRAKGLSPNIAQLICIHSGLI